MNKLLLPHFIRGLRYSPKLIHPNRRSLSSSFLLRNNEIPRTPSQFQAYETTDELLREILDPSQEIADNLEIQDDIQRHNDLLKQYVLSNISVQQNVFIVQPFFYEMNSEMKIDTKKDFVLEESISLIHTLEWKVADYAKVGVTTYKAKSIFYRKHLNELKAKINSAKDPITMIFISHDQITPTQRSELEYEFQIPVLDRYNVVLQIFRRHAITKEAKLQIKLAEIPYLKARLMNDIQLENVYHDKHSKKPREYFERHIQCLKRREKNIKARIEKLRGQRELLRKNRIRNGTPVVAIVGYTNCGKTSLIQALTKSSKLSPEDKLFATLDVTVHGMKLNCNVPILLVDTVGFMGNIPTELIKSFASTLEDALLADVIVHIRDLSHPNHVEQNEKVMETLESFLVHETKEELKERMIVVVNKIDKLAHDPDEIRMASKVTKALPISALEGYGLEILKNKLEKLVLEKTQRQKMTFRVKTGSEKFKWLIRHLNVYNITVDPKDMNYTLLHSIVRPMDINRVRKVAQSLR